MKIIIEHSRTKRVIEGPFNICGSRQDLLRLAECIAKAAMEDFNYGWVRVFEMPAVQSGIVDTSEKWD